MEERFVPEGELVVRDKQTGLLWQRGASVERMVWKDGVAYVQKLNDEKFAGCSDWRLPTKEELGTLIQPEENRLTGLYIDAAFDKQRNCWSSTTGNHHQVCYADFYYGDLYLIEENYANHFVRAVRTG